MKLSTQLISIALYASLTSGAAQAALLDRGGGLIYDTDLNVTWLADANSSAGTSFDNGTNTTDGLLTWANARDWASGLVFGGFSDWRLPTSDTCSGFNCTNSELGHLFYVELGGVAGEAIDAVNDPDAFNLFVNLSPDFYWTGTTDDPSNIGGFAWALDFSNGNQTLRSKGLDSAFRALAVRDGDVAVNNIPEPATLALLGLGFAGLSMRWRMKRQSGATN